MEKMSMKEAVQIFGKQAEFMTDFGQALAHVKNGGKAARCDWIGCNM